MNFVPVQTGKAICRRHILQAGYVSLDLADFTPARRGLQFQIGWSSFAAPFEFSTPLS